MIAIVFKGTSNNTTSSAFIYTSLHLFNLATAKHSKMCLVYTKAEDVVGITYY